MRTICPGLIVTSTSCALSILVLLPAEMAVDIEGPTKPRPAPEVTSTLKDCSSSYVPPNLVVVGSWLPELQLATGCPIRTLYIELIGSPYDGKHERQHMT